MKAAMKARLSNVGCQMSKTITITILDTPFTVSFFIDRDERGRHVVIDELTLGGVNADGLLNNREFEIVAYEEIDRYISQFGLKDGEE